MHFKLDENVPVRLKLLLKGKGYKVSTVFEERLSDKVGKDLFGIYRLENKSILIVEKNLVRLRK